jgi:glycerol-1-phosphate dehydrogenase [NAD(P)+]
LAEAERELFELLGPKVAAALSARRGLLPRYMLLSADAAERLAVALRAEVAGRSLVVLADERTRLAAGERVQRALAAESFSVRELIVPDHDRHPPRCDDVTRDALLARLPACDAIVGVGSGVISDLAKWLALARDRPAAIFGTAASMNGYAAANIAPAIGGVKTLVHGRAHRIVAADPAVLAAAPRALTTAGLGDVIAKTVSTADWLMNDILFGEDYREAVASIIDDVEQKFLAEPSRLARADAAAVSGLFEALVYSGCAMTLQGSSLPASGGEHLISHALDMRADAEGGQHDLHGRQVGLGTIFAAAVYERVLTRKAPRFDPRPLPFDRAGWGSIADAVAEQHARQTARLAHACAKLSLSGIWERVRAAIAPRLPEAAWIKRVLAEAGAAHRLSDLGLSRERFLWAVLNGAQMRERFTSLDLGWATGVLPDEAPAIVDALLER